MKEIWDWIEKYILGKNYNIKCGNGLNKIYHNHKSRGIGSTELIRKTFYLKHWGGPIGEVKYSSPSNTMKSFVSVKCTIVSNPSNCAPTI